MAPTIYIEFKTKIFNSFWIKYVNGFDIRYHCQKCLKGSLTQKFNYKKSNIILNKQYAIYLNEFKTPYIYICGVTSNYDFNLHVPIKPNRGEEFEIETIDLLLAVKNASLLTIQSINLNFPEEFSTCRNFQFGYQYFKLKDYENRLFYNI